MIVQLNTQNPQKRHIARAVEYLRDGGLVVYPTDTTYAFGCDLNQKGPIEKIIQIKGMSRHKLLSLVCSDLHDISNYAYISNTAYALMRRLLPGPYTFILQATKLVPRITLTNRRTIGIRVPDSTIARAIVEELGHPIITSSVKLHDELLAEPIDIHDRIGHAVDMVLDGGIVLPYPSTVIDLTGESPVVIREGKGDVSEVLALAGEG